MESWAQLELAPWDGWSIAGDTLETKLRALAAERMSVYLFAIDGATVRFDDKGIPTGDADPTYGFHSALVVRGRTYAEFLSKALAAFGVTGKAVLAVDLADQRYVRSDLPLFAFQRRRFEAVPLLPDIDMIDYDFYIGDYFADDVSFANKRSSAIFVGSTTGDSILTQHHVANDLNARIRAARFFKDRDGVIFDLPQIVQYDTPDTLALVKSFGIEGRLRTWREQTDHRFLLSLDGNGATCSRPYLALAGQGVLLKYNSPNELYYFRGLRPWREFIPIKVDSDVLSVVEAAEQTKAMHAAIAARSRRFIAQNVSRIHAMRYTAELLQRYILRFGKDAEPTPFFERPSGFAIDAYVHLGDGRALWSEPAGWTGDGAAPIAGFALVAGPPLDQHDIAYAAVRADGSLTPASIDEPFAGARDRERPLHGLMIELVGGARSRYRLQYQARFEDGFESGLLADGTKLWRREAAMTSFRIVTTPRRKWELDPRRWFSRNRRPRSERSS